MSFVKKYGNKDSVKNFVWIIALIFIVTLGYKIYAKFFGKAEPDPDKVMTDEEKATATALSNIHVNESLLTISELQAANIADLIFNELDSTIYCNVDPLVAALTPLNNSDLLLVVKKFDVKPYKYYWWSTTEWLRVDEFTMKSKTASSADKAALNVFWHKVGLV